MRGGSIRCSPFPEPALMSDAIKHVWSEIPLETVTPAIDRKLVTLDRLMLAQVFLKKGAIVPAHEHHNEQGTYILSGALRFWLGEHADNPGDAYVDVAAGEVLMIPGGLRHRAEALEDTLDLDVFTPPREDWLNHTDSYFQHQK